MAHGPGGHVTTLVVAQNQALPTITGTVAVTLAAATSVASGEETYTGTVAVTLANVTCVASGTAGSDTIGTVAVTLANVTSVASGTETITGTVAVTLANATSATVAWTTITGTSAVTLSNVIGYAIEGDQLYVTEISANGRYLLDQNGDPYFIHGNSPQTIAVHRSAAQTATFFASQRAHGYNSSQILLIANSSYGNPGSVNQASDAPFGNMSTFATPNEDYWTVIDDIFDAAELYGVTIWAAVMDNISYGFTAQSMSTAQIEAYGTFLGDRYKTRPNLVWMIGIDFNDTQWSLRQAKYASLMAAIRATGDTHLHTTWLISETISTDLITDGGFTGWDAETDLNFGYTYMSTYYQIGRGYSYSTTRPVFLAEANYEGEHNIVNGFSTTAETLRRQAWWAVTWGACGQFFGQGSVWTSDDISSSVIDNDNVVDNSRVATLLRSYDNWHLLVPDTGHLLLTAGYGTFDSDGNNDPLDNDYATMAKTADGTLAVGYFPDSRSITLDTSVMTGPFNGYWLDPTSGDTVTDDPPITHPGTNDAGQEDWVYVLEGTPPVTGSVAVTLASVTCVASGTVANPVTGTVNVTLANATSTAAGSVTANDVTGTVAVTLAAATLFATGAETFTGTVAQTLANVTTVAAGTETITGTVAVTLAAVTCVASGSSTMPGTLAVTLADFTSVASGSVLNPITGSVAVTLANVTSVATGTETYTGTATPQLAAATCTATGSVITNVTGTVNVTLQPVTCVAFEASIVGTVILTMAYTYARLTMASTRATLTMESQ